MDKLQYHGIVLTFYDYSRLFYSHSDDVVTLCCVSGGMMAVLLMTVMVEVMVRDHTSRFKYNYSEQKLDRRFIVCLSLTCGFAMLLALLFCI